MESVPQEGSTKDSMIFANTPKRPGIYAIVNANNNRVYIGSAVDIRVRLLGHYKALSKGTHPNPHLQRAWDKHGHAVFQFKAILLCDSPFLILWEQITIDGYRATIGWDNMYNISPTAGSNLGTHPKLPPRTAEHNRKIGISRKLAGFSKTGPPSQAHRDKIAKSLTGKPKSGKGAKGQPKSTEHCKSMSRAMTERWKDPEFARVRRPIASRNIKQWAVNQGRQNTV